MTCITATELPVEAGGVWRVGRDGGEKGEGEESTKARR